MDRLGAKSSSAGKRLPMVWDFAENQRVWQIQQATIFGTVKPVCVGHRQRQLDQDNRRMDLVSCVNRMRLPQRKRFQC